MSLSIRHVIFNCLARNDIRHINFCIISNGISKLSICLRNCILPSIYAAIGLKVLPFNISCLSRRPVFICNLNLNSIVRVWHRRRCRCNRICYRVASNWDIAVLIIFNGPWNHAVVSRFPIYILGLYLSYSLFPNIFRDRCICTYWMMKFLFLLWFLIISVFHRNLISCFVLAISRAIPI